MNRRGFLSSLLAAAATVVVRAYAPAAIATSTWKTITVNPARALRCILAMCLPPECIDEPSFERWEKFCDEEPTVDGIVLDGDRTLMEVATEAANVGRAAIFLREGKLTIVQ